LLSAQITGRSEDNRAKVAEKRRIYANCIAALTAQYQATVWPEASKPDNAVGSPIDPGQAAINAVSEVQLIASFEVATLAVKTAEVLLKVASESKSDAWAGPIAQLIAAMRADLGEPLNAGRK
jgi:hypothetical protein